MKVQQGLDCTSIMTEAKYSIIFSRSQKKFCISLTYNGSDSFSFVNTAKISQFKAKNSDRFGYVYDSSVDYNIIDTSNVIDIHKYLTKSMI